MIFSKKHSVRFVSQLVADMKSLTIFFSTIVSFSIFITSISAKNLPNRTDIGNKASDFTDELFRLQELIKKSKEKNNGTIDPGLLPKLKESVKNWEALKQNFGQNENDVEDFNQRIKKAAGDQIKLRRKSRRRRRQFKKKFKSFWKWYSNKAVKRERRKICRRLRRKMKKGGKKQDGKNQGGRNQGGSAQDAWKMFAEKNGLN